MVERRCFVWRSGFLVTYILAVLVRRISVRCPFDVVFLSEGNGMFVCKACCDEYGWKSYLGEDRSEPLMY